jgi:hypothetical protein
MKRGIHKYLSTKRTSLSTFFVDKKIKPPIPAFLNGKN